MNNTHTTVTIDIVSFTLSDNCSSKPPNRLLIARILARSCAPFSMQYSSTAFLVRSNRKHSRCLTLLWCVCSSMLRLPSNKQPFGSLVSPIRPWNASSKRRWMLSGRVWRTSRLSGGRFVKYYSTRGLTRIAQDFGYAFEKRSKKGVARDNYV